MAPASASVGLELVHGVNRELQIPGGVSACAGFFRALCATASSSSPRRAGLIAEQDRPKSVAQVSRCGNFFFAYAPRNSIRVGAMENRQRNQALDQRTQSRNMGSVRNGCASFRHVRTATRLVRAHFPNAFDAHPSLSVGIKGKITMA